MEEDENQDDVGNVHCDESMIDLKYAGGEEAVTLLVTRETIERGEAAHTGNAYPKNDLGNPLPASARTTGNRRADSDKTLKQYKDPLMFDLKSMRVKTKGQSLILKAPGKIIEKNPSADTI